MTTTESFTIYEVLNRHFKSESDARSVVQEIESSINRKFESEKSQLASKDDINRLELKLSDLQATIERRFNNIIMWTVSTGIAIIGILIAVFRLLPVK